MYIRTCTCIHPYITCVQYYKQYIIRLTAVVYIRSEGVWSGPSLGAYTTAKTWVDTQNKSTTAREGGRGHCGCYDYQVDHSGRTNSYIIVPIPWKIPRIKKIIPFCLESQTLATRLPHFFQHILKPHHREKLKPHCRQTAAAAEQAHFPKSPVTVASNKHTCHRCACGQSTNLRWVMYYKHS